VQAWPRSEAKDGFWRIVSCFREEWRANARGRKLRLKPLHPVSQTGQEACNEAGGQRRETGEMIRRLKGVAVA
jgi:hypothetical protein